MTTLTKYSVFCNALSMCGGIDLAGVRRILGRTSRSSRIGSRQSGFDWNI